MIDLSEISYINARKACKCECLQERKSKNITFKVSNELWVRNQMKQRSVRESYGAREMDKALKASLYEELKKSSHRLGQNSRIKLEFLVILEDQYENLQPLTLCESCFVFYNEHISKSLI
jgi:ATP-dependent Clp protease ATP-binding subunit ClpA